MKKEIIFLFLTLFFMSSVFAYSTNVQVNTLPDKNVQIYFVKSTAQLTPLIEFIFSNSSPSGELSFNYTGNEEILNTILSVQDDNRTLDYLLSINLSSNERIYQVTLNSSNLIDEETKKGLISSLVNSNSIINSTSDSNLVKGNSNLAIYLVIIILLLILAFIIFLIKKKSSTSNKEEAFDLSNPDKPVKLYQKEDEKLRLVKEKLKEVSKDIERLKSSKEKALKLRKEMIQRERDLSSIKA